MPVGRFSGTRIGPGTRVIDSLVVSGFTTYTMSALNTGWCVRFMAHDARDIKGVHLVFNNSQTPGTMQLRIETIDATTGKPTGTLYDPAAVLNFTPALGDNSLTFATLPTAGLVAGTEYAVVLLTTVAGTAHVLSSHVASVSGYPLAVQTAADGTTRSNFAEVANAWPILTFVLEDDAEETLGCNHYTVNGSQAIWGTNAAGLEFIVPSGVVYSVESVKFTVTKTGTPGDLRVRILNSTDVAVSGATVTIDKDSYLTSGRFAQPRFAAPVPLSAGTYRVVLDSSGSTTSGNSYSLNRRASFRFVEALTPAGFTPIDTANITATPVVWSRYLSWVNSIDLHVADITGGRGNLIGA